MDPVPTSCKYQCSNNRCKVEKPSVLYYLWGKCDKTLDRGVLNRIFAAEVITFWIDYEYGDARFGATTHAKVVV